jgi:transcriptional regulator with XRE-family HTH domain
MRTAEDIHPVDRQVGNRVKLRRKAAGLTQADLARRLGLTFQQIQKYETGQNRISASKLHDIAKTLQLPVAYFFATTETCRQPDVDEEQVMLLSAFAAIDDEASRHALLTLAKGLALQSQSRTRQ